MFHFSIFSFIPYLYLNSSLDSQLQCCISSAIMNALPILAAITAATAAATRISEMIDRIPAIDSEHERGKVLTFVKGDIEFRKVDFCYPSRPDTLVLQGLNLKVQAGKMIGLVGGSGSGKSTIIALLERFYDPVKGEILLDGYKLRKFQLQWLRSQMGLVNQEPILFATSIKENILFGKEGASMENVISAAKAANAHDFISKLPQGYDTQVSHNILLTRSWSHSFLYTTINFVPFSSGWAIRSSIVWRTKAEDFNSESNHQRPENSFA